MKFLHFTKFSLLKQYFFSILLVLLISSICYITSGIFGYKVVALILLMVVSFIAMVFEIYPVLVSSILSAVILNFFFIPPLYTFHIENTEDIFMFLLYFFIALVNAVLTYKIRLAESKSRDKEEKEKTIKLYNTLLNSLSHELRTPISTILGAVDTLKDNRDKLSLVSQSDLLTEIDKAIIRLNRQVENLLSMSRLENGMLKPKFDWCDINEIIHSLIQKNFTSTHNIYFQQDDNLPLFKVDAGLIEQALQNLISNAIQYTPDKSIVEIKVYYQSPNLIIIISDNGPGFPISEISMAFNKFYRMPNTKPGGIGLGLSIVKGFIEAQNGNVSLCNNANGGACFTLCIPVEVSFLNHLKNE